MSTADQSQTRVGQDQITETDETYRGDVAMLRDCSRVASETVLPHMEILHSQVGGEMAAEIAELTEAAQQASEASTAAVSAVVEENQGVAEAHADQPQAELAKSYYHE